jgi:potassium/hydrogen antiporter
MLVIPLSTEETCVVTTAQLVLAAGALLAGSVVASAVAARLRFPALLLFLAVGIAAGSEGAGWIAFDDAAVARDAGMIALAVILFDGGFRSGWSGIRSVIAPSLLLAGVGTIVAAAVTAVAAVVLFGLDPLMGLLIGSVIASTDSAAVFGVLRGSALPQRLVRTLEGEAGFNDPVALVLVIGVVAWIQQPGYAAEDMLLLAGKGMVIGAACGFLVGKIGAVTLRLLTAAPSGLYPVASLALGALAFGGAETMHGSGLLAVYLAALVLGDADVPGREAMAVFHNGAAWAAQAGVFLILGLLVFPSRLAAAAPAGAALGLVVVVLARPLAALVATVGQRFDIRERALLSMAGMRGAAPIVFATIPVAAGVPGAGKMFDVVFFAVVVSTLLQGSLFEPFARALHLAGPAPAVEDGQAGSDAVSTDVVPKPVTAGPLAPTTSVPGLPANEPDVEVEPWTPWYGDPSDPDLISGVVVVELMLQRYDRQGALVALEDGRFAVSGPTLALGSAAALRAYAERMVIDQTGSESLWWRTVATSLAELPISSY